MALPLGSPRWQTSDAAARAESTSGPTDGVLGLDPADRHLRGWLDNGRRPARATTRLDHGNTGAARMLQPRGASRVRIAGRGCSKRKRRPLGRRLFCPFQFPGTVQLSVHCRDGEGGI